MDRAASGTADGVLRPLDLSVDAVAALRNRPPHAVIDIGSNSVRLVVYDAVARAPLPRFNEKSFCRLADGLDATGRLSDEGIARTLQALRRFRAIAEAMGVGRIDVLATEATRRAANGPALVAAIAAETGLQVRVLQGHEEATFAALGVISGFFRPVGVVGDMGGGSLEIAEALDDRVGDVRLSLPLGALPVQALMARAGRGARREIDAILAERLPTGVSAPVFYPVGGGWRALAKLHLAATGAPLPVVHGHMAETDALRAFLKDIARMSPARVARLPGVSGRRADTLPAAALVLDRVLRALRPGRVVFSALGVREGWLYAQLSARERYFDPLVEGAQGWGMALARVPAFAPALVRWTAGLFPGEVPATTRLRVAACAISDIAWRDTDDFRAQEAFRRVAQFPFIGLDHGERLWLAAAIHARYAGRVDDPALAPAFARIAPGLLRRARVPGSAFLVGYRFSGSVPEILESSRLTVERDRVVLQVGSAARGPDSEALMARLRLLARAAGVAGAVLAQE
jgi:exopolyphosphatase/guanosine-5'-triphosphate,3'-diphosphate pyrophosphatase